MYNIIKNGNNNVFWRKGNLGMDIWKEDESSYTLSRLTNEDINLAEKHFNVKLPKAYINLLKQKNGGELHYNALPISLDRWENDNHIIIDHLLGIKENNGIMETDYYVKEWEIKRRNIILLSGDGHEWLALDYDKTEEPKVIFIQTDNERIIEIYSSFDKMLENLYLHEEIEEEMQEVDEGEEVISYTLEEARKLVLSQEKIDVLTGIEAFNNMLYDEEILAEQLDNILRLLKHSDQEIVDEAGIAAWKMIISSYDINKEYLDKLISEFEKSDNQLFKTFLELMGDYIKENGK